MANVRVYIRKKVDGKRNYYPAPSVPDLTACYYLRYEGHGKQVWQRVGHFDLVAKAKLLLERKLFAEANGYLLPAKERISEVPQKPTGAQTIDGYLEAQSMHKIRGVPLSTKTVQASRNVLGHFSKFCKKKFFGDIERKDLEQFMEAISLRYDSDWTVHNYMINVLAFMRACGRPGLMKNSDIPDPHQLGVRESKGWPNLRRNNCQYMLILNSRILNTSSQNPAYMARPPTSILFSTGSIEWSRVLQATV